MSSCKMIAIVCFPPSTIERICIYVLVGHKGHENEHIRERMCPYELGVVTVVSCVPSFVGVSSRSPPSPCLLVCALLHACTLASTAATPAATLAGRVSILFSPLRPPARAACLRQLCLRQLLVPRRFPPGLYSSSTVALTCMYASSAATSASWFCAP
jgi:hypothetical protein